LSEINAILLSRRLTRKNCRIIVAHLSCIFLQEHFILTTTDENTFY